MWEKFFQKDFPDTSMNRSQRTKLTGLVIALVLTLTIAVLQNWGAFDKAELRTLDLFFQIRGSESPPTDILLVTIDENTRKILQKGLTQITRAEYAQAVDILSAGGAKLIVFDMDFATSKEDDEILARSLACAGNVILSRFIAMGEWVTPSETLSASVCPALDAVIGYTEKVKTVNGIAKIEWRVEDDVPVDGFRVYYSIKPFIDPLSISSEEGGFFDVSSDIRSIELNFEGDGSEKEIFANVVGIREGGPLGEGAVNIVEDVDDRVRRMPLVVGRYASDVEKSPALSLETAVRAIFDEAPKLEATSPLTLRFSSNGKVLDIPLLEGNMLINYLGGRDTFERVSFGKVITGAVEADFFRGKIVLIGNTHQLAHDEYPTPFGRKNYSPADTGESVIKAGFTSGLEIHANALATILEGRFILPLGQALARAIHKPDSLLLVERTSFFISVLFAVLGSFLFILMKAGARKITALFILAVALSAIVAIYLFTKKRIWCPFSAPLSALVLTYGGGLFYHLWVEGREKRWIKDTFGKYLAPSVVEQIVRDPTKLKLGGEERELTAFFSDIQGFTSISEQLGSPSRLVELLNEYLSAMADIIESYEGTVDKYEGDAVIAFWGAPVFFEDHALKACLSALDQQKRFAQLRKEWEQSGKWPPAVTKAKVRMGLNTGLMVVGNMGSRGRMNYTIMGDAVNLASRLEGVNKQYGTLITVSETTYSKVKEHLEARELDIIRVVGKAEPVKIYELLSRKGEISSDMKSALGLFSDAVAFYRQRRWDDAVEKFESVLKILSDDPPSRVYIQRCKAFLQEPPPDEWDGVFEMRTK